MAGKNKCTNAASPRILWVVVAVLLWTGSVSMALEVTGPEDSLIMDVYNMPVGEFSVDLSAEIYYTVYVDSGYTLNLLSGSVVHLLIADDGSFINIEGGTIDDLFNLGGVLAEYGSTITVHGTYVSHTPAEGAYFDDAVDALVVDNGANSWDGVLTFRYEGAEVDSFIPFSTYADIHFFIDGEPSATLVDIDIKPGSYPNSINLGSKGVVPVAIFSTADFDATTIPADTIFLAGSGVAVRGKDKYMAHQEDVDGDGRLDLVVQVETQNLDPDQFEDGGAFLRIHETPDQESLILYEGWDEVRVVPSKKQK